jgi:hypothetical protein
VSQPDLWAIVEAADIRFQQHEQAWRGWFWALPGVFDRSGPYDTKEEALAHALRWLVGRARQEHATELAAIDSLMKSSRSTRRSSGESHTGAKQRIPLLMTLWHPGATRSAGRNRRACPMTFNSLNGSSSTA